ncbi:MAG: Rieske (2Fe-2S) protein [Chloroflexota bacterium]|nr:MAG: Rieske (2Fe-2S) protein [Chloroflexota bacterium]
MSIDRREFIHLSGCSIAAILLGSTVASGCTGSGTSSTPFAPSDSYHREGSKVIVHISRIDNFKNPGEAVQLSLPDSNGDGHKIILVHLREDSYLAFENRCTHRGKELNYLHNEESFACSGLRSRFDLSGNVLHPPAESPLQSYKVTADGRTLILFL